MSSIQHGIQTAHVVAEMFVKYGWSPSGQPNQTPFDVSKFDQLIRWAKDHKTVIVLNGGDADDLIDLRAFLDSPDNPYPHAFFEESPGAMNGCLTSVGIVLPERMYDKESTLVGKACASTPEQLAELNRFFPDQLSSIFSERQYTKWELTFLARRVVCPLAI